MVLWGQNQEDQLGWYHSRLGQDHKVSFVTIDQMNSIILEVEEALTVFALYVANKPKILDVNEFSLVSHV